MILKAYSRFLCLRCFKLLDELDEAQHRTTVLKSDIESLYNHTLEKRNITTEEKEIINEGRL